MQYVKLRSGFARMREAGSGIFEKYLDLIREPYLSNLPARDRAVTLLRLATIGVIPSLMLLTFYARMENWAGVLLFAPLIVLLPIWFWALRYKWLRVGVLANLFVLTTLISFQSTIFLSNGLQSPFFAWQILSPIAAIQLVNWRELAVWASVSFICLCTWYFGDLPSLSALVPDTGFGARAASHILLFFVHLNGLLLLLSSRRRIFATQIQLEDEMKKSQFLITDIVKGQLEERGHLYRELSEELGPMLSNLKQEQKLLRKKGSIPSEKASELQEAVATIEVELDRISRNLESSDLEKSGLYAAILNLCQHLESATPTKVVLNIPDGVTISMDNRGIHVYRILQEALRNIARHAQASEVQVNLRVEAGQVVAMHIEDNGVGIAAPSERRPSQTERVGQGLQNIADRVALLDGQVVIDTPPVGGTRIRISLPDPIHQRLRLPFK